MRFDKDRPEAVLDIECFRNYFLAKFRCINTGRIREYEKFNDSPLDRQGIARIIRQYRIVTFNGNHYDILMLCLAMTGASNEELKQASDRIILGKLRPWQFCDLYGITIPSHLDHIDLIEVAPGQVGLKLYGGRMHSQRLEDLPLDPDAIVTEADLPRIRYYCGNDLLLTVDLRRTLAKPIGLRFALSERYGIDLRSKSDAQAAEAVISAQAAKLLGRRVYRPEVEPGRTFKYKAPDYVRFTTPALQEVLDTVLSARFVIAHDGTVKMPPQLAGLKIAIGNSVYRMGIGGLHSSEKSVTYYSNERFQLIDRDVASYYPSLILRSGLAPKQMGHAFLQVYQSLVDERLAAKAARDKSKANSLKIFINGTFGKLGSPYSLFYAPELMIQVTITGQLCLLMLIEAIEQADIRVVSANTDGLVSYVPRERQAKFDAIIRAWEQATQFETEDMLYRSLHSRDVNNYIAITNDGEVKRKGAFAPDGLQKNPANGVCVDAVVEYLLHGTPLEDTVERCDDIRKFVNVRQVNGGAEKGGEFLGKVIRWYYAVGESGSIRYVTNGNTVPRSEGAKPLMDLPDELPDDIDYDWYIREAHGLLKDLGTEQPALVQRHAVPRSGLALARLPDAKNIHTVDLSTGVALCGSMPPGRHDRWVEYDRMPKGHRECPKCVKEIAL